MNSDNTCFSLLSLEEDSENPEENIIKFLQAATQIFDDSNLNRLNSSFTNWNSTKVFINGASGEPWDKSELKEILLNDCEFKKHAEIFVKFILQFIMKQTDEFNKETCNLTLDYADKLSKFLMTAEINNIVGNMKYILKFLNYLFGILESIKSEDFVKKGPLYQFIAKIIQFFEKIKSVQNEMLLNINNKFKNEFVEHTKVSHYETYLIYLTILKGILKYKLEESSLQFGTAEEEGGSILLEIKDSLNKMVGKLPEYFEDIVYECINLL